MSARWYRFFFFFKWRTTPAHQVSAQDHFAQNELCSDYMNVLGGIGTGHVCWGESAGTKCGFIFVLMGKRDCIASIYLDGLSGRQGDRKSVV